MSRPAQLDFALMCHFLAAKNAKSAKWSNRFIHALPMPEPNSR
jgi:hypothetical protein